MAFAATKLGGLVLAAALLQPAVNAQVVIERAADGSVVITNHKRYATGVKRPGVTRSPARQPSARSSRSYTTTPEIEAWITQWATQANLDQELVKSLIAAESSFDAGALSAKGAIGLMQLMPGTARELGIDDPWDPESNIRGGTRYLRQMLDRFNQNLELALAAYNAGPGAVEANGGVPPYRETQAYVRRVLSSYRGQPIELSGVRVAGAVAAHQTVQYRPIRTSRDANGHLVISQ